MRRYLFLLLFSLSNHNTSMTEQNLSLFHSIRNEHFELYILDTRIPWSAILNFLFCALEGHGRCGNIGIKIHCLLQAMSERNQICYSYSFYAYHSSRRFLSSFSVLPCYFLLYFTDFCANVKYFSDLSLYFLFNLLLSFFFLITLFLFLYIIMHILCIFLLLFA